MPERLLAHALKTSIAPTICIFCVATFYALKMVLCLAVLFLRYDHNKGKFGCYFVAVQPLKTASPLAFVVQLPRNSNHDWSRMARFNPDFAATFLPSCFRCAFGGFRHICHLQIFNVNHCVVFADLC